MDSNLNNLKKHIFFEFLNLVGRAFVLVRYSDNVVLGNRGFTAEEKENGIILVFNSRMNFLWDDYGITATLVFGTSPQKCFIPVDDIMAVYSPDLNAQFMAPPQPAAGSPESRRLSGAGAGSPESRRLSGAGALIGPQPIGSQKEGEKSVKKIEPKKEQKTKTQKDQKHGHVIKVDFTKKRK